MGAEEDRRTGTHNELHRPRDRRNNALPEPLQDVAVDKQDGENNVRRTVDGEEGLPIGDNLLCPLCIRADKECEQMRPKGDKQNTDGDGKGGRHLETGMHTRANALILLCAVVLCRIRRHGIAEGEHGHDGDGVDLLRCRVCRHRQCAEVVEGNLEDDRTEGNHGGLQPHWKPQPQMRSKERGIWFKVLPYGAEFRDAPPYVEEKDEHTDRLCGDRRTRRARDAQIQHQNGNRLKNDIDDKSNAQNDCRCRTVPEGTDKTVLQIEQKKYHQPCKDDGEKIHRPI